MDRGALSAMDHGKMSDPNSGEAKVPLTFEEWSDDWRECEHPQHQTCLRAAFDGGVRARATADAVRRVIARLNVPEARDHEDALVIIRQHEETIKDLRARLVAAEARISLDRKAFWNMKTRVNTAESDRHDCAYVNARSEILAADVEKYQRRVKEANLARALLAQRIRRQREVIGELRTRLNTDARQTAAGVVVEQTMKDLLAKQFTDSARDRAAERIAERLTIAKPLPASREDRVHLVAAIIDEERGR